MPLFVWQRGGRGNWAPSLFWGDLPRDMLAPENRGQYVFHPVPLEMLSNLEMWAIYGLTLDYLAREFPAPPAEDPSNAD